ncbi:MAG: Lrp/AsnC ligand binding domain-containing protein [Oscillospiraceae bacterium]|nr:Lrp/AsnC ligand binding domain-containing protein [Oscillospiraceae bacterium]
MEKNQVTALIEIKAMPKTKYGYSDLAKSIAQFDEVDSVRLMSGSFDLAVMVKCDSVNQVGKFVAECLSPLDGVIGISTHFVIGRYKDDGKILTVEEDEDDRGLYTV